MESRGRKMLGLSKPKPRKEKPEEIRTPLGNLTNKNLFKTSFDHCRRFLNTVKTGAELRSMENTETDLPMYDPDMSADISIAEEVDPDNDNVTDPEELNSNVVDRAGREVEESTEHTAKGAENVAPVEEAVGHVRFGNLGFGNFADAEELVNGVAIEKDVTRNRIDTETQERVFADEQVEGEEVADDLTAGPSHASDDATKKKRKRRKGTEKQSKKN